MSAERIAGPHGFRYRSRCRYRPENIARGREFTDRRIAAAIGSRDRQGRRKHSRFSGAGGSPLPLPGDTFSAGWASGRGPRLIIDRRPLKPRAPLGVRSTPAVRCRYRATIFRVSGVPIVIRDPTTTRRRTILQPAARHRPPRRTARSRAGRRIVRIARRHHPLDPGESPRSNRRRPSAR